MSRKLAYIAVPLAIAYGAYRVHDLNTRYPLVGPPSYAKLGGLHPSLKPHHSAPVYITTHAHLPIGLSNNRLDAFLAAFYSTWTLRIEGLLARLTGYSSLPEAEHTGITFCNGLFPVTHKDDTSVVVAWRMPSGVLRACEAIGLAMVGGGVQELSAFKVDGETTELSYGCAEYMGEGAEDKELGYFGTALHQFYMRFLLDSARRRLDRAEVRDLGVPQ
jgi:hypothetical protein